MRQPTPGRVAPSAEPLGGLAFRQTVPGGLAAGGGCRRPPSPRALGAAGPCAAPGGSGRPRVTSGGAVRPDRRPWERFDDSDSTTAVRWPEAHHTVPSSRDDPPAGATRWPRPGDGRPGPATKQAKVIILVCAHRENTHVPAITSTVDGKAPRRTPPPAEPTRGRAGSRCPAGATRRESDRLFPGRERGCP